VLFKDGFDDPFRNRLLRCEKKVIDNGVVPISHRQGIGNELEACDRLKSLLICLHDRRVVLFDKLPRGKQVALVAFNLSRLTPWNRRSKSGSCVQLRFLGKALACPRVSTSSQARNLNNNASTKIQLAPGGAKCAVARDFHEFRKFATIQPHVPGVLRQHALPF
jgi:hypothetical protein